MLHDKVRDSLFFFFFFFFCYKTSVRGVLEQQRRSPACVSTQTDQRHCYSPFRSIISRLAFERRTSGGGYGNHSVSLPILLLKFKVNQIQIAQVYGHFCSNLSVNVPKVQQQPNSFDCGVFAIAHAVDILF